MRTLIGTTLLINQSKENSFNLDTILLSNFVNITFNAKKVIDLGCGNGAISLYLSSKTTSKIIGIEIQNHLAQNAIQNVLCNNLNEQIEIVCNDIKKCYIEYRNIDCIVSNPPFFKVNAKTKTNELDEKSIARHEVALNLDELLEISSYMLKTGGKLFMIHRPERLLEILDISKRNRLAVKRIRFVHPYDNKNANHLLIELHKDGKMELVIEPPLVLYEKKNDMTKELLNIYQNNNYRGGFKCY